MTRLIFHRRTRLAVSCLTAIFASQFMVLAGIGNSDEATVASQFNVPMPTMGGAQLWTDYIIRNQNRLQQNALTGHWRWLDPNNVRRAWGSRTDVQAELDAAVPPSQLTGKTMIVLIHGLMRTDKSMASLQSHMQSELDADVIRFGYASSRMTLAESAKALRYVLEDQPASTQFAFVGHSMGNIITRRLIHDVQIDDSAKLLPRMKSMVMLGPPNNGATIAKRLGKTGVFGWIAGPGAMELGEDWDEIESTLATPPFPFAIVAGRVDTGAISNPLVDGPSDMVVSVDEARLAGASDVHIVDELHSFLMDDVEIQAWTTQWLIHHGGISERPTSTP